MDDATISVLVHADAAGCGIATARADAYAPMLPFIADAGIKLLVAEHRK